MLLRIYSIRDEKSLSYGTPFFQSTDGLALRAFADLVNDPKSIISKHPEDFSIWFIGTFDDEAAQIVTESERKHLADAIAYKAVDVSA